VVTKTYFPDVLKDIVTNVSGYFNALTENPFPVFFEKGFGPPVGSHLKKHDQVFPLVWLSFPFSEGMGDMSIWNISCSIHILHSTKKDYTQQQREDITFKPVLIPVYEKLLEYIHQSKYFETQSVEKISHTRFIRPYWGGTEDNKTGVTNLWKQTVDCISMEEVELRMRHICP
jgi:hypothetical protein